jgi:WD40 repeat protein
MQIGEGNRQTNYFYGVRPSDGGGANTPTISLSGQQDSPYQGLSYFEEDDAAFFFGREKATTQILERLSRLRTASQRPGSPALLVVSGVSGAGKSSLLRAGVLPRIAEAIPASPPGGPPGRHVMLTPSRAPLSELAGHLAPLVGGDALTLRRLLQEDPSNLALTAYEAAGARPGAGPQDRLVLIVDQFEQVFTQCGDEVERRRFFAALHAAASTGHGPAQVPPAIVIVVVRADFEARCADYEELAGAVQERYLLPPMTERQLRLAITEPARVNGSSVADDLVEELVRTVRATPSPGTSTVTRGAGVLPHLSHALDQAWRGRTGDVLTLADYERAGGIEDSIGTSADRAYTSLSPLRQQAARELFTRLVITSADGTDTAGRATRAELVAGKDAAESAAVHTVVETFAAERLLALGAEADSVEISHEALLSAWPLLAAWLTETAADRVIRTQLRTAAVGWTANRKDQAYLYRGTLLDAANGITARIRADPVRNPSLSPAEREFIGASDRARRRTAGWRRALIASLAVLTLGAFTTAGIAVRYASNAASQHAIALSRQLAAESITLASSNPRAARQLAVAAWSTSHTAQAASILTTLATQQWQHGMLPATDGASSVDAVAFSPDGKLLATASLGAVQLWNPETRQAVGHPLPIRGDDGTDAIAFSPDSKLLAIADNTLEEGSTVQLWNVTTGKPSGTPLPVATGFSGDDVYSVAFSPDGKLLAAGGKDGAELWNPGTGKPVGGPLTAGTDLGVDAVAFSPDGRLLATAGNAILNGGMVQLWKVAGDRVVSAGKPVPVSTGPEGTVYTVAFSPDGNALAIADNHLSINSSDGLVQLWDPRTGKPIGKPLPADPGGAVRAIAFGPHGLLATAGQHSARLWNWASGTPVGKPLPDDSVSTMAFSPDGKLLATDGDDGTAQLWNPATEQPEITVLSPAADSIQVAFSPDGKLLATASGGTVRLLDPASGQAVGRALLADTGDSFDGGVNTVTFSPDGKLLAASDGNGTALLWSTASGKPHGKPLVADSGGGGGVLGVAFSPDGKLLATADSDGAARLWDPATGDPVGRPLPDGTADSSVSAVAFSPDGKLLATADSVGMLQLWDPATRKLVGNPVPVAPEGNLNALAFSPDGKLLATLAYISGEGSTVQLWDTATRQPVGPSLPADGDSDQAAVGFSPDGRLLAASSGGPVRLWDVATRQPIDNPEPADVNKVIDVAFSPDGSLLATVDTSDSLRSGTVALWNAELFVHPDAAMCADVGPPPAAEWHEYAPGELPPKACS